MSAAVDRVLQDEQQGMVCDAICHLRRLVSGKGQSLMVAMQQCMGSSPGFSTSPFHFKDGSIV